MVMKEFVGALSAVELFMVTFPVGSPATIADLVGGDPTAAAR